jgi:hypothetical protein
MIEDRDENNDLSSPLRRGQGAFPPGDRGRLSIYRKLRILSKTIKQDFSSLISFSLLLISS